MQYVKRVGKQGRHLSRDEEYAPAANMLYPRREVGVKCPGRVSLRLGVWHLFKEFIISCSVSFSTYKKVATLRVEIRVSLRTGVE